MRNFLLTYFVLALVLSEAMLLSYAHKKINSLSINMTTNSTSPELIDSKAVEVDGVFFETLVPERVLVIPENKLDVEIPVKFGIRITNKTQKPYRFSWFYTLSPNLVQQDGQALQLERLSNGIMKPKESYFPLAMPEESKIFYLEGTLSWHGKMLQLGGSNKFGDFWYFDDLKPGTYQIQFIYQSNKAAIQIYEPKVQFLNSIWTGEVATPFAEFYLVQP
jgi:hypothetical protein